MRFAKEIVMRFSYNTYRIIETGKDLLESYNESR